MKRNELPETGLEAGRMRLEWRTGDSQRRASVVTDLLLPTGDVRFRALVVARLMDLLDSGERADLLHAMGARVNTEFQG